jgi:hypothetical protein
MKKLYYLFIFCLASFGSEAQATDSLAKQQLIPVSTDSLAKQPSAPDVVAAHSSPKQLATATVKGVVTDEKDNSPMIGVNVSVKGTTNGVSTNEKGEYELHVPLGTSTLAYTYVGYQERSEIVTAAKEGEVHVFNVKMTDMSKELDIVVVSGNKVEKKLGEQTQSVEVLKGQNITNGAQGIQ